MRPAAHLTAHVCVLLVTGAMLTAGCMGRARPDPSPAPTTTPWSLDRQPVPRTLDEALEALEQGLGSGTIARLRVAEEDIAIRLVPTLGRWIQEHWGLWTRGPLFEYFERLGLERPDDMAAVILTSLWRRLHYRPLMVEDQIRWYRAGR